METKIEKAQAAIKKGSLPEIFRYEKTCDIGQGKQYLHPASLSLRANIFPMSPIPMIPTTKCFVLFISPRNHLAEPRNHVVQINSYQLS